MKKITSLLLGIFILFSCSKNNSNVNAVTFDNTVIAATNTALNTTSPECKVEYCPSDNQVPQGCTSNGMPCTLPVTGGNNAVGSIDVDETAIMNRIKKPTNPSWHEFLLNTLKDVSFKVYRIDATRVSYVAFDVAQPGSVLYSRGLTKSATDTYYNAGNKTLSVSEAALQAYKNNPSEANRKVVLLQVFDQFNMKVIATK